MRSIIYTRVIETLHHIVGTYSTNTTTTTGTMGNGVLLGTLVLILVSV